VEPSEVIIPTVATALIAAVASASTFLRERDVTLIQKQADDLTRYSQTLEAEIRNIITTAQVGQAITGTRNVGQLLKQVVNLIVERFDLFYHAQVFLIDDAHQWAVLQESTGEAGTRLLARNHRLQVGSQSVIGQVTGGGRPVIVLDTDTDPVHRRNELLPNTRSEMALPLIAGGQVIGALDIQSTQPFAFRETDIRVFQTMADQLSVAIENARLFERAQRDLQEIELLNRRLTGEGWRQFQAGRAGVMPIGFEASAQGVKPVLPNQEPSDDRAPGTVSLPLMVRGEPIGMLDVTPRSGETPDPAMRNILEQVAERVALALDSTRLSEQALRQAEREQVLSRLSAELQATTDLDVILRVAAREASRALGTPRGFVHLIMEYGEATAEAGS
jgi:GAF domain-containing protein